MNTDDDRLTLATQIEVMRELIRDDCLTTHGLKVCRQRLRHPDTVQSAVTLHLTGLRSVALHEACCALASNDGELDYYRGVGDLLMTAPDDLGGIA